MFDAVEHIGSTSVPGLAAKPVIDLMAAAASLDAVAAAGDTLAGLGYRRFDTGMPGRLFYYRDEAGHRAYQLHVVPAGTWDARNERLLRDHLRATRTTPAGTPSWHASAAGTPTGPSTPRPPLVQADRPGPGRPRLLRPRLGRIRLTSARAVCRGSGREDLGGQLGVSLPRKCSTLPSRMRQ